MAGGRLLSSGHKAAQAGLLPRREPETRRAVRGQPVIPALAAVRHSPVGGLIAVVPTPDHYLPLLYVIGTRTPSEPVTFPVEGVEGGSISMLAVRAARHVRRASNTDFFHSVMV